MRVLSFCAAFALAVAPCASHAHDDPIGIGFSNAGTAEPLVVKTIASAHRSIRIAAYSFTNNNIARALIDAHQSGVDVQVVADFKANVQEDSGRGLKVLEWLAGAGIPVHLNSHFAALHDKYMVIDGDAVQTGSFNYTVAAARYNAENVLVLAHRPDIAAYYLADWQALFAQGGAIPPSG